MISINKRMSNRLKMISESIKNCSLVYDIGTDHAYVPISLLQKNICVKAYATDVKKGPLLIANNNIEKYHLEDKIITKRGDGLDVIDDNPECVIIAGMGGILITNLIKANIKKARKVKQLIIQAMNAEEIIRKFMLNNGFSIDFEKLTKEGNKIYNLMSFSYTDCINDYLEYEYYTSRYLVNKRNQLLKKYLQPKIKRFNDIIKGQVITNNIDKNVIHIKNKLEEIVNDC